MVVTPIAISEEHAPAVVRRVLQPYDPREACTAAAAASALGVDPTTIRRWALQHSLGRVIGGRFWVSKVALSLFVDGETESLALYHRGERQNPRVAEYFRRCRVPIDAGSPLAKAS